jgi:hypothetical protein
MRSLSAVVLGGCAHTVEPIEASRDQSKPLEIMGRRLGKVKDWPGISPEPLTRTFY